MTNQEVDPDDVGVLEGLDGAATTTSYWYLALLACIGGFLFGYDTAVIGSVLDFIPYELSDLATGYLVAGASLGAAVGALGAGPLTDRFGRKSLLMVDAGIFALGSILSAVTVNAEMLLLSRTLIGLAVGADSAIATAYIAEFAPSKKRGQLSIIQQWMITVGILSSFLIALLIFKLMPEQADGAGWRIILGLGAVPAVIAVVLRARMPESPRWLMSKGRYDDTKKALGMLGIEVTEGEVRRTADRIAELEGKKETCVRWVVGLDQGREAGAGRGVRLLRVPADHRHQHSLLLRAAAALRLLRRSVEQRRRVGHGRTPGSRDPGCGQRGGDVLRLPLHRPAGPPKARAGWVRRHGDLHARRGHRNGMARPESRRP